MTRYTTPTNTSVTTTKKLGEGGEGAVFDVAGQSGLVAKIYHPHRLNQSLAAKVIAMTRNPPEDATRASLNHVSIAWPIDVLYSGKQFVGYTMPKIKKADDLYDLLQPQQRAKQHGSLNHRHLYRTARNLAIAMDAIHQKGYVLGDVNFKNALFNDDALITIVDCDSMQVTDAAGVVHRCLVGVPEYTPADLQGVDFSQVSRTKNHDAFGLAVLIFQLLMQGFHPFAGKPRPGEQEVEQSHIYCISKGIFPYISNLPYEPPRAAPSMLCLPVLIQQQFERAFTQPNARPTPKDWATVLAMIEPRLIPCANDAAHWYPSDGHCVICEIDYNVGRRTRTGAKPSATVQMQVPLPAAPSSTTGPLRPAAISKPVVTAPQSQPPTQPAIQPPRPAPATPRPTKPATPKPTVAPAPSRPVAPASTSQTLPPLVSPQSAPRVVPPTPQPRQPQVDIIALVTAFISAHRIVLVPVAVILMALAIALSSSWNSSTTQVIDGSSNYSLESTQLPEPTLTAPTSPTQFVESAAVEAIDCSTQNFVAAMWPMLADSTRNKLEISEFASNFKSYDGGAIKLDLSNIEKMEPALDEILPPECNNGTIVLNNPLLPEDPEISSQSLLCLSADCLFNTAVPLMREYQLIITKTTIESDREIDPSTNVLFQFFDRIQDPKIHKVMALTLSDEQDGFATELLTPFVRTPLLFLNLGNSRWSEGITTQKEKVSIQVGEKFYDADVGGIIESTNSDVMKFERVIIRISPEVFARIQWRDGTPLTSSDFVTAWKEHSNYPHPYIESIVTQASGDVLIYFYTGIPVEIANRISPPIFRNGNATNMLSDSTTDWEITRESTTSQTYNVNHRSDERKIFEFTNVVEKSRITRSIREKNVDVVIIDAKFAPEVLTSLPGNTYSEYNVYLVPTGSVFALEQ